MAKGKLRYCEKCGERIWRIYIRDESNKFVSTEMFYCERCNLIHFEGKVYKL